MRKRFSLREFALLMAPVLAVGALALWVSTRAKATAQFEKSGLDFRIEKPTTLEAFRGAHTAFVVKVRGTDADRVSFAAISPYLTLVTPRGTETSRQYRGNSLAWDRGLWNYTSGGGGGQRFLLRTGALPAGEMKFGLDAKAQINGDTAPPTFHLGGRWTVDRAQIQIANPAALPRPPKPWVSLRSIKIIRVTTTNITGEAVFRLESGSMDAKTPLDIDFSTRNSGMGWGSGTGMGTPQTARRRVIEWTVSIPCCVSTDPKRAHITGRASADNRWPLGFQIEPFAFKTARVGQKLRFKQFPVALPKA